MSLNKLLATLQQTQPKLRFADVLATIREHYHYTPTAFHNGPLHNAAAENEGSCLIFAFASLHALNQEQTLHCFGEHYQHVLAAPTASSHPNLRQFMLTGLSAVSFSQFPLKNK